MTKSFPNKRLRETEPAIDNNQSLLYDFVDMPIHRNYTNMCLNTMKGKYATIINIIVPH